ncbi:MAG: molecular chaperone GrpE [Actinomycetota bacterium]|nr:molecular chaperone GrpE [Actinomycetota bacterium]
MEEPSSVSRGGPGADVEDGGSRHDERRAEENEARPGPVIRDKRRLDPQTGQVRAAYASIEPEPGVSGSGPAEQVPAGAASGLPAGPSSGPSAAELAELEAAKAASEELLNDLQRVQAEYVNYRRRVDRDRDVARDLAVAGVLESLLPVLDDIHLARQHGDLEEGPFAAIAEKLESTLARFGMERYGAPGEAFDPTVHEALIHTQAELAEGTTVTTVVQVLQPGYRAGERILRAARVAVADPV